MPWGVKRDRQWYVVYNRETGRVLGKHASRAKALKQLAALKIHTGEIAVDDSADASKG